MKTLQTSKSIQWQTERANWLQRACQTIKAAIQRGEKISRAIRRAARSRLPDANVSGQPIFVRLHHGAANGLLMALKRMRGLIKTHCQPPI